MLEIFSALCGEANPINACEPEKYQFSPFLPAGLSGTDATSRKRLFGNTNRYNGLTKPIKAHIIKCNCKETLIAYCEATISIEDFPKLCSDFGVSGDVTRSLVFLGIFEQFLQFAKSGEDSVSDTFIADFVVEQIMHPIHVEEVTPVPADAPLTPLCAGDDAQLIRQKPNQASQRAFYAIFSHYWVIKNCGVAVWDGRYMDFMNCESTPLKLTNSRIDIKKTPPGGEVEIAINVDVQHIEGAHEIVLDMKDCEGRLCFPDKRVELRLPVTVGWNNEI
ncbi:MAG: hypothetical protein LBU62_03470 [Bacteroidales bacterium]|nr:hypothetical protein [Bacteroidales bacterium]